jgi:hypothetical protein
MKIIKKTTLVLILLPFFLVGAFGQWMISKAKILGEKLGIIEIQAQCWTPPPPATTGTTFGTTDGTTCTTSTSCCAI